MALSDAARAFFPELTGADYAAALLRLLPPSTWEIWRGLGIAGTLATLGAEFARVHNALLSLLDEFEPGTADALLGRWEALLGLPDPAIAPAPATLAERQAAAAARFLAQGAATPDRVYARLAALGFDPVPEIQIGTSYRADESAADERLYDQSWAYTIFLWVPDYADQPAGVDSARVAWLTSALPAYMITIPIDGASPDYVPTPV